MAIPLNMLIGCTASGKSRVALEIARRCGGEIVSVDSMKVYRRMDIGTAKPSAEVRAEVVHHLLDIVEPSKSFSLGRYVELADAAFKDITARGKPIIAAGGTMLYVQGLTQGVFEGPSSDPAFRRAFRKRVTNEGSPALHAELVRVDPEAAARIHPNDARRIERALEVHHVTGEPISRLQTQWANEESPYDCRVVALMREKEEASRRINARVKRMIDAGFVDEVRSLLAEPEDLSREARQAVGYAEIIAHLNGEMSLEDAVEQIKINTRRLAKHQRTWMRRMTDITRIEVTETATVEELGDQVTAAWGGKVTE
jgi:tRNA dimethylallyltransferase